MHAEVILVSAFNVETSLVSTSISGILGTDADCYGTFPGRYGREGRTARSFQVPALLWEGANLQLVQVRLGQTLFVTDPFQVNMVGKGRGLKYLALYRRY